MPDITGPDPHLVRVWSGDEVLAREAPGLDARALERLATTVSVTPPYLHELVVEMEELDPLDYCEQQGLGDATATLLYWRRELRRLREQAALLAIPYGSEHKALERAFVEVGRAIAGCLRLKYGMVGDPRSWQNDGLELLEWYLRGLPALRTAPVRDLAFLAAWMLHLAGVRPLEASQVDAVRAGDDDAKHRIAKTAANAIARRRQARDRKSAEEK